MSFYAHTHPDFPDDPGKWEPLFSADCQALAGGHCDACERLDRHHGHLNKVAWWTAKFAAEMFPPGSDREAARQWGYVAGLWHDLGKFHPAFQRKLAGERLQIEHAGVGAALAKKVQLPRWEVLAFVIAGHHSGLANALAKEEMGDVLTPLEERLNRAEPELQECEKAAPEEIGLLVNAGCARLSRGGVSAGADLLALSHLIRGLFSALVDADSLATEAYCAPAKRKTRFRRDRIHDSLETLCMLLGERLNNLAEICEKSPVNIERLRILLWCRTAAEEEPGFFQLSVPTGGGKTLSAMEFALRHACRHAGQGMRRVVIAVPYTSIIEQNAGIYCDILGTHNVIEHHSNLDDFSESETAADELTVRRRLACENWDAPVIVTTNVQLFESLFAHKRRRTRKLHNLAGSVIILDEAQCVPAEYLRLILSALRDLVENHGCSVVVSTATQPAWRFRRTLPFGIPSEKFRAIVPLTAGLAAVPAFDRVRIEWRDSLDPTSQEELASELIGEECAMAIVHRKKDARQLARRLRELRPGERVFHLSTNMCPVHRRGVLAEIRNAIRDFRDMGISCRVVSTQLVEAGVDLDFPVVYRALAGLDSIAQAAGRCNREGRMTDGKGRVVVFVAETEPPDGHLRHCAEITRKMLTEYGGQLDLRESAIFEEFFVRLYRDRNLDAKNLVRHASAFNFETLGREFRLIEDGDQTPVVVAYDAEARERLRTVEQIAQNADEAAAGRYALRALQPYTILVRPDALKHLRPALRPLFPGSQVSMLDPDFYSNAYDPVFGLTDDEPQISPRRLVVA
jgi:CRISPR-associated endonuclease/helicase Cas3